MRIAFIGFGEAARAFVDTLREHDDLNFRAFDILSLGRDDLEVREAAARLGVGLASDPAEAVADADWIVSAVTAADSLEAAVSVAGAVRAGQVFLDINSVSAGRKVETARMMTAKGAAYVDMAVMAPVHPRGHRTPVLIAGPDCATVGGRLAALGFDFRVVGAEVGAATSIKMVRSLFVKGMEAVTVQTLLAASRAGCFEEVRSSLAASYPQLEWPGFPAYQLERVTRHGVRRAAEMRESAATMEELGFSCGADLAAAIAGFQQVVGEIGFACRPEGELSAEFARLAAACAQNETGERHGRAVF